MDRATGDAVVDDGQTVDGEREWRRLEVLRGAGAFQAIRAVISAV